MWLLHLALPMLGLWLLIARPEFDLRWEDHLSHLWLVAGVAAVGFALAVRINQQARARADARLVLVSLAFMAAAGFLAVHAVATPGVLVHGTNLGFAMSAPIGLFLASGVAALSAIDFSPTGAERVLRAQTAARVTLIGLLAATGWAGIAVHTHSASEAHGPLVLVASAGSLLYAVAAIRFFLIHRRRPAAILLSVITSYVLLAEALIAMAYARNWAVSWWEWHLLMLTAFGFVAYSAHIHYQREGSRSGLFNSVALEQTLDDVRREHTAALEALTETMLATPDSAEAGRVTARLAAQFGLTERQAEVLEQGAVAVAREREQTRRLGALVDVGLLARVSLAEAPLLTSISDLVRGAFGGDQVRIRTVRNGRLQTAAGAMEFDEEHLAKSVLASREPAEPEGRGLIVLPLTVKDRASGVLEVYRPQGTFSPHDRFVLRSLAGQISLALENARLYQHLDGLFRSYLSPDVAGALIADPAQAALGGETAEVTVLIADLAGFTAFSERSDPSDVVAMLNTYYGAVVPCVLAEGGTITQFVGDAVVALFNAPVRQHDHALRAARAGLALQEAAGETAEDGWPSFRVGVNTGPALVGNIGSEAMRHFTAIGDTVNLAARLESTAPIGGVVISAATRARLPESASADRLGAITVKGKTEQVEAYLLKEIEGGHRAGVRD
ncbi:adenylate/guanylate cyclase domain-containing protein [Amycolatopsis sp. NPDC059657]|uniref:adenylate/guanylate cyclase domain-containing protein n=1 Tax=Amycolatopsis sp. NPDC059657 TaxID=3346899 RepID=UPI00366B8372